MEHDNRTKFGRMQDWAKETASKYHLAPEPVAKKWRLEREERELQKDDQLSYAWEASPNGMKWRMENPGANLSDYENAKGAHYADIRSEQLHSEWKRSPEGQKWEREHEELAHFGKVLTANDYAEKRADLENDSTIDRGDIGWMMEKWAGNPKWREIADRDNAEELKYAHEYEERAVRAWEKGPEGKQHLQEQEDRLGNPPTEKPREERTFSTPTPPGEWTHKDNVIYDRETCMIKALSALDRGDITAAKQHLVIPDKVRDVNERATPPQPQNSSSEGMRATTERMHGAKVIDDKEIRRSRSLSAGLLRGGIIASKPEPKTPSPSRSSSKLKDRDLDMEM